MVSQAETNKFPNPLTLFSNFDVGTLTQTVTFQQNAGSGTCSRTKVKQSSDMIHLTHIRTCNYYTYG